MNKHLSAEEIRNYLARNLTRGALDRVSDHVYTCETCHRDLLAELQKRFPIEIDLDELAGLQGWHLEGEELAAYVEGRMDELNFECATLHLEECGSCMENVSGAFEPTLEYTFKESPRKKQRTISKGAVWRTNLVDVLLNPPARVRFFGIAAMLLMSAIILWAVLHTRPAKFEVAETSPSGTDPSGHLLPEKANPMPPSTTTSRKKVLVERWLLPKISPGANRRRRQIKRQSEELEAELIARDLVMPPSIERLDRTPAIAIRGDHTAVVSFSIIGPFATLISTDQPTFRWTPLPAAENYRVSVYDEALHPVKTSEPVMDTKWTMPEHLKAGVVYTWTVTALRDGKDVIAPAPPARAEFSVLEKTELAKLDRKISGVVSNVARGALYVEAGLLADAELELKNHLSKHRSDQHVRKVLQMIRSWRGVDQ